MSKLYLASRSPRRHYLLSKLVANFAESKVDIVEQPCSLESPEQYVLRIATDKALAARAQLPAYAAILSADTEVVLDGRILGKPAGHHEALEMLMSLSGRAHDVYTAVVLHTGQIYHYLNHNRVWFRRFDQQECEVYRRSYPALDKAGGYGIQDRAAAFVVRLQGSYSGVMGLPLAGTRRLLAEGGLIK